MYTIYLKRSAEKELDSIPAKTRTTIITAFQEFKDNPRPPGCKKLTAREDYRVLRGNCRILYVINEKRKAERLLKSKLIGLWKHRTDIGDSVEFARKLRQKAGRRDW